MTRLHGDTRGAMVVLGLFMAVMLTGFMYYVVGIGETIVYRETMQDAADAGAFSAAVVHARGMNILALINMIMAAALAVLVALKLLQTVIIGAIVVATALAFVTFGASLAAVPPLTTAQNAVQRVHNALRGPVFTLLRFGNKTAGVVRRVMPPAAAARGTDITMSRTYRPPVRIGVAWPADLFDGLPTHDGDFGVLCEHAGEAVGHVVGSAFSFIGYDRIENWLADKTGDLTQSFSSWFCSGEGGPPSLDYTVDVPIPEVGDTSEECRACAQGSGGGSCSSQCDEDAQNASLPDEDTGRCMPLSNPNPLCEERARRARVECRPGGEHKKDFFYQEATMRRFFWTEQVQQGEEIVTRSRYTGDELSDPDDEDQQDVVLSTRYRQRELSPCAFGYPGTSTGRWNTTDLEDLCDRDAPVVPPGFPALAPEGRERASYRDYTIIRRLFGCHVEREESVQGEGDRGLPADTSDMAPQRMRDEDDDGNPIELGDEHFQVRAFVHGERPNRNLRRGVARANWGRLVEGNPTLQAAQAFGMWGVAQAEFYYPSADLEDREDWLWNMRWKARLRRFRFAEGNDAEGTCQDALPGADCGGWLGDQFEKLNSLVAH